VAGFKMHSHSIDDHTALLKTLLDLNAQVILLQRSNRVKHALSLYRYHEEGKSQFDKSGVRPPSDIDLDVFQRWVKESVALHRQSETFWDEAVAMLGPDALTRVQYEEFIDEAGKVETMERLAGFLDIEGLSYTASAFKKATPDILEAAVVNYDALVDRYRGTEFEQYLSD
jgi:LPS sulfotransferase NodH